MSQLVKLKAAVQPHGILKSAVSGLTAQHSQQQQRTSAVHRQAAVAMPARRWIATAATTHAAVASPMPSVAAATASQSHSSNSSSSSSSSSSTATSFFLGLLGLVGGGVLFAQTTSTVHADSASSLPALPLIDVSSPAASSSSPSEGGSANGKASKKKGKSGRKAKRKLLEYPGKFNKLHSTADQLVNVPVNQGLRAQIPLSAFAHDPMADKSIVLIPIFELGGPNGPQAQLVVQSSLGRKHGFEAYLDVGGNSTGHYKYTTDFGMSVKPAFQMTPHGNMMSIDVDYKGREFAATGQLSSQGEATISFNQSLTNNLVGGIELNYIAMTQTNLNGGLKFTTPEKDETYAVSKKGGKYTLRSVQEAISLWQRPLLAFLSSSRGSLMIHISMHRSSELLACRQNFSFLSLLSDLLPRREPCITRAMFFDLRSVADCLSLSACCSSPLPSVTGASSTRSLTRCPKWVTLLSRPKPASRPPTRPPAGRVMSRSG
jgi:hypothetical protein